MTVIKRDGSREEYDLTKIIKALRKANAKSNEKIDDEKLKKVVTSTQSFIKNLKTEEVKVEDIHKAVENSLMKNNCYEVARQYMNYRRDRDLKRFKKLPLVGVMESKLFVKNNEGEHQNANLDEFSFGGRKGEMDSAFLKDHALNYYISPKFAKNHIQNRVYIHDLDSYILGMHNCFGRNTKFVTADGIKSFYNFVDGEQVDVLCNDGKFHIATVRYYGKKPMNNVIFKRNGVEKRVQCTADHRWILQDGTITTNLSVNDRVALLNEHIVTDKDISSKRDAEMFSFGFVIGDGVDKGKDYITVRLCGSKMQYKHIFERACYHLYTKEDNGDEVFIKRTNVQKQAFLSNRMWEILSLRDKQMLFAGYYAADGAITKNHKGISTSDERILQMIKDISALSGYHLFSEKTIVHKTNYKNNAVLYHCSFTTHQTNNTPWTVVSINKCKNQAYEAWCIEEPITHSFILDNGLVTGNCLSVPMDEMLSSIIKTRQTLIRPAGSVNTAFQLIAVYFQLQSLQQFGGVAATHIDWTLVPYVRKSFMKHYIVAYLKSTDEFAKLDLPDMMFKDYRDEAGIWRNKLDDWIDEHKTEYLERLGLKFEDFTFDNKNLDRNFRQAAVFDTIQETKQAAEGMLHNLNSLQSRSGNQLPFSSINYGTCTLPEGRIIIRAILDATIKGTGNGQTSIFPCQIFQMMDGVNTSSKDPNYDLFKHAIKCTSMRMYPNYVNCDWSQDQGYNEVEFKTKFLDSLSDSQKETLIKKLQENPKLCDYLGIDVVNK